MPPSRLPSKPRAQATEVDVLGPNADCPLCPRLVAFRQAARQAEPSWFNSPVPAWSADPVRLLVVGLAPGLRGANRTGRPFTGDHAGILLYQTLTAHGFARGHYDARPDDGLQLVGCAIINAVRCVPPQNKPTPAEIGTCRQFLSPALSDFADLRAIVALGRIAHESLMRAAGVRLVTAPFAHARAHEIAVGPSSARRVTVFDSYHCSRYNTNTGVLTPDMFDAVFAAAKQHCSADAPSMSGPA